MTLGLIREDFVLRDLTLDDAPALFAWRCSPRIATTMLQPPPPSFEAHLGHLRRLLAERERHALYILEHRGRKVGHVALKPAAGDEGCGDWSIYVGEEDVPRGTGFALGVLALERIFARPGFTMLRTRILAHNVASQRLHERLAFDRETPSGGG